MKTRTNLIIIDDFYSNPHDVRQHALSCDFDVSGNYPGSRTKSFLNESTKYGISNLLFPHGGNVLNWHDDEYSGSYQFTTRNDRSWIHHDNATTWAGVLYLTPNAPLTSGTGLYKHKGTGHRKRPEDTVLSEYLDSQGQDLTKWDLVDRVSNVFNRLVLYRGDLYHMSQDYFGTSIEDGRLFQTFFITTEY